MKRDKMKKVSLLFAVVASVLFVGCSSESNRIADNDLIVSDSDVTHSDDENFDDIDATTEKDVISDEENIDDSDTVNVDEDFSEIPDSDETVLTTIEGIYTLTGKDESGEEYSGQAEIRGETFSHLITFDTRLFKSQKVALAYEGVISGTSEAGLTPLFDLSQAGYVVEVDGKSRTSMPTEAAHFSGKLEPCGINLFCGTVTATVAGITMKFDEKWKHISALPGDTPLWHNQRVEIDQLPEPSETEKANIRSTFKDFHERADIQPYVNRPEFQKMVHYMIFDPTDYDFYQTKPGVVRVIQSTISDFSVAEAWNRADAYTMTLAEKEQLFAEEISDITINSLGMISHKSGDVYYHDGDSLLWTGVYVATLAMKYMNTNDAAVLTRMLKSLDGIIGCLEITPDPSKDFARTLRLPVNDGNNEFHRGSGTQTVNGVAFSDIEYKEGGNNDMSKGPFIGFLWAYQVLKDKPEYKNLITRMTEALKRMREHHPVFKDGKTNQTLSDYELGVMMSSLGSGYFDDKLKYEAEADSMFVGVKEYFDSDYMVINEYGVSDWSGNHLTLWTLYNYYTAFLLNGRGDKASYMQEVMRRANNLLKYSRTGLFQMMMGGAGLPIDNDSVQDAIWRIKELPLHRATFRIDWTLNPSFCVSPIPALPWKNDWHETGRVQSIRAYPLFEQSGSSYWWKDNILGNYSGGGGASSNSGLDFFILYWFGQYCGLI